MGHDYRLEDASLQLQIWPNLKFICQESVNIIHSYAHKTLRLRELEVGRGVEVEGIEAENMGAGLGTLNEGTGWPLGT